MISTPSNLVSSVFGCLLFAAFFAFLVSSVHGWKTSSSEAQEFELAAALAEHIRDLIWDNDLKLSPESSDFYSWIASEIPAHWSVVVTSGSGERVFQYGPEPSGSATHLVFPVVLGRGGISEPGLVEVWPC